MYTNLCSADRYIRVYTNRMLIPYRNTIYETDKSILVAGPTASGKSYLITRLEEFIQAPMVHREVVEEAKLAPANSIIHWPIAEKFPHDIDLSNVGSVLIVGQHWESYCNNVDARKHGCQYSRLGLASLFQAWRAYFTEHKLPMVDVPKNDCDFIRLIPEIIVAMRLVIPY